MCEELDAEITTLMQADPSLAFVELCGNRSQTNDTATDTNISMIVRLV